MRPAAGLPLLGRQCSIFLHGVQDELCVNCSSRLAIRLVAPRKGF